VSIQRHQRIRTERVVRGKSVFLARLENPIRREDRGVETVGLDGKGKGLLDEIVTLLILWVFGQRNCVREAKARPKKPKGETRVSKKKTGGRREFRK